MRLGIRHNLRHEYSDHPMREAKGQLGLSKSCHLWRRSSLAKTRQRGENAYRLYCRTSAALGLDVPRISSPMVYHLPRCQPSSMHGNRVSILVVNIISGPPCRTLRPQDRQPEVQGHHHAGGRGRRDLGRPREPAAPPQAQHAPQGDVTHRAGGPLCVAAPP